MAKTPSSRSKKKTPKRKAPATRSRRRASRKASSRSRLVEAFRVTAPGPSHTCKTCPNKGWVKAIAQALDSMLAYDPTTEAGQQELPLTTSLPHVLKVMQYQHERLGIDRYTLQIQALRSHIYKCEKERWDAIQEKRAQGF